ncbi:hypothetical protein DMX11_23685 [Pseudomonas sp. LB-090624]|jgi:hypothetical protein|nr:hypothetical protein DM483_11995 [Pseudomonas sp. SMT-1]PYB69652.1 hypothetical protein DMX11_23685 [Pseudomonas sp. LB-090624]
MSRRFSTHNKGTNSLRAASSKVTQSNDINTLQPSNASAGNAARAFQYSEDSPSRQFDASAADNPAAASKVFPAMVVTRLTA